MVRAGEFPREFSRQYPARDACRNLSAELSEQTLPRPRARNRLGALSGEWRHHRRIAPSGGNAQLGAPLAAISGPHRPRNSRSLLPFPDGRYCGGDHSGEPLGRFDGFVGRKLAAYLGATRPQVISEPYAPATSAFAFSTASSTPVTVRLKNVGPAS